MTGTRIKLASRVYGSILSIVKIHIICRTISTLAYMGFEGHITFHLPISQSVALCFTICDPKKLIYYVSWLREQTYVLNPVCFSLVHLCSVYVVFPVGLRSEQPVLSPRIWHTRDSDVAASQNGTVRFICASPWTLSFPFAARSSYAIIF